MPHLLIVEDEPVTAWALAEGLTDDGFTIDTFANAEDALAWLGSGRADLIIADVRLPGMSGLEFARAVRRAGRRTPFVLLSAYGTPGSAASLRRWGVRECFTKPFRVDLLRRAVRRALEPRRATSLERAA
jgi:two-component system C4-dicarboxylate transport response regulator DctD